MPGKTVELLLVGPTYQSRSLPLSAQVTRNLIPELQQTDGALAPVAFQVSPGTKQFSDPGTGADRGTHEMAGTVYKVSGQTLHKIQRDGKAVSLGTIQGSDPVIMADDGSNLIITTGGAAYQYDGANLTTISGVNNPHSVAFLNRQMIYGETSQFAVSSVGDPDSISTGNFATPEADPDNLVRVFTHNQRLYLFGGKTIEPWFNTGQGSPPFKRVEGGVLPLGLGARHSVSSNDRFIYFLSNRRVVYQLSGTSLSPVTNVALGDAWDDYSDVSDAIGHTFTLNQQNFYVLTFPSADKTWLYSEQANLWFELATGVKGKRHLMQSHVYAYGKHLIGDYRDAKLYEWDLDYLDEDGSEIQRIRTTGVITSAKLGAPGRPVTINRLELLLESGTATATGEGSDAEIAMRYSPDGGKTWSAEQVRSAGQTGDFLRKVEWFNLGQHYDVIFQFLMTDPVKWSLYKLYADVEVGIG